MIKLSGLSTLTGGRLKGLKGMVSIAIIDAFLASLPYAFLYYIVLDMLSSHPDAIYQLKLTGFCGLLMLVRVILARVLYFHVAIIGFDAGAKIRIRLGEHLRRLPMGFFYRSDMSSVNNTLLKDIDMIENIFTHLYAPIIATASVLCFFSLGLLLKDWRMALAMLSTLPLAVCAYILTRRYAQRWQEYMQLLMFKLNDALMEYIDGLKELKAYRMTGAAFQRLSQVLTTTYQQSLTAEKAGVWPIYSFNVLVECGFIVLLVALTWGWVGERLPLSEVLIFLIAAVRFFRPLLNMSMFLAELNYFGLAVERVEKVFAIPELVHGDLQPNITDMRIRLDNVCFAYPDKPLLFNHLNLTIEKNKITALVGPSGSGKSTLASLIARFWDIEQGHILVGDKANEMSLAEIDVDYWQRHLSVVFQKSYVLNETIANNLRVACPDATNEQLLSVCRAAQLLPLLDKLPSGLDTEIGAGGVHLSGGELQRLAIARALLKDAPLIILDEATASLDPENEQDIQLAMQALIRGKTVLVIAHKLSSIQYVDHIIVMDSGQIVEEGDHSTLIQHQGLYAELWSLQQQAQAWQPGRLGE
ncbi:ABC transporter ATP-binding protein [Yersinia pseudotuberculosis]|uniref:ABC transporter ATP-binding protein n=1 Tax=Yersinia pseudotuberculosis TaxID=633 RepID=UPI0005E66D28|nr:ABC transporter ATP-binding protein [Yersinia pseudotuberculosis]AXY34326.1 ABC transporter ATP-binding protein [Yersinia pseudotuberculosis]AYX10002.1 ABC transporter ATP-binding protein [Yersinia pseudotuberculosis]MBO1567675.1 ATP-binding cassette domain-containing protein [Yersinia pseudotuberculosis]MBO1590997.1 ATP-binding cassette domain-containing protein [Yersinia pseudotuberculosis]MBO1604534.1 ATP-binding cassette domain-containing protein [Yersinia pseudotuberculosis]